MCVHGNPERGDCHARVGWPYPVSEATNQSQFFPTCVSGFVLFFFSIYIYFLLDSILFLILFSPDTMALLYL